MHGAGRWPDADQEHLRETARAVVRRLNREHGGRFFMPVGELKKQLAHEGIDAEEAYRYLTSGRAPLVSQSGFDAGEYEICYSTGEPPPPPVGDADPFVSVDNRDRGRVRMHLRGTPYEVPLPHFDPDRLHFTAMTKYLDGPSAPDGPSPAKPTDQQLTDLRDWLRQAFFPPAFLDALAKALGTRRHVRIRLDARGRLAGLPWELTPLPRPRPRWGAGSLSIVRHVGAASDVTLSPSWLDARRIDHVCVDEDISPQSTVKAATDGYDVRFFDHLAKLTGRRAEILHVVRHGGKWLTLADRNLFVTSVLERRPTLVVLGVCRSGSTQLATEIVEGGVPYVIAMAGAVWDGDHATFCEAFYPELKRSRSVDRAVAAGRQAVGTEPGAQVRLFQHGRI